MLAAKLGIGIIKFVRSALQGGILMRNSPLASQSTTNANNMTPSANVQLAIKAAFSQMEYVWLPLQNKSETPAAKFGIGTIWFALNVQNDGSLIVMESVPRSIKTVDRGV